MQYSAGLCSPLDLIEQWLDTKEGENFEFKEAKENFHFDKLAKYCCALSKLNPRSDGFSGNPRSSSNTGPPKLPARHRSGKSTVKGFSRITTSFGPSLIYATIFNIIRMAFS
jgi:hypothetical protein